LTLTPCEAVDRELYLGYGRGDDPTAWTTELQEPVVAP
jgi:hypothetical protein